jgi:hypothetical protein
MQANDSGGRYLGVAFDHGTSFNDRLAGWGAAAEYRFITKQALVELCLAIHDPDRSRISGLVLGLDLAAVMDNLVKKAEERKVDVWLGLPDQDVHVDDRGPFTTAGYPLAPAVRRAAKAGAAGVKVGMGLGPGATWPDVLDWLRMPAELVSDLGVHLVVEPYFRADLPGEDRTKFLADLATLQGIRFAKLDVHQPETWSEVYSTAPTRWLARSDGKEFKTYLDGLRASIRSGCAGTMVGNALWRIDDVTLLGREYEMALAQRLITLHEALHNGHPVAAGAGSSQHSAV